MPLKRNFLPCRCLKYCRGLKADSFVDNNQSIDSTHVIAQVCIQLYTVQIYMLILYQVERWLRLRRQSCLPSKLQKFQETGWRCLLYLSAFFYFSSKNQMYFSRVGGCSTYLPSSTESFVSGKSRGSTASTTAGTATRIIRCAVKKKISFLTDCNPGGAGCLVLLHGRTLFLWDSLNQVEFYFGCNGAQLLLLMALPAWHCSHISGNFIAVNSLDVC